MSEYAMPSEEGVGGGGGHLEHHAIARQSRHIVIHHLCQLHHPFVFPLLGVHITITVTGFGVVLSLSFPPLKICLQVARAHVRMG